MGTEKVWTEVNELLTASNIRMQRNRRREMWSHKWEMSKIEESKRPVAHFLLELSSSFSLFVYFFRGQSHLNDVALTVHCWFPRFWVFKLLPSHMLRRPLLACYKFFVIDFHCRRARKGSLATIRNAIPRRTEVRSHNNIFSLNLLSFSWSMSWNLFSVWLVFGTGCKINYLSRKRVR